MKILILVLAVLGLACLVIPLHIAMTGLCLLALAAVLWLVGWLKRKGKPRIYSRILIALTAVTMAVVFGAMGYIAFQGRDADLTENRPEFVVVLGAQIHGDQPSLTLKKRLDKTFEFLTQYPEGVVFVSGGQGPDEQQTEASVMAAYLEALGIDKDRIFQEGNASDTRENLIFSRELAQAMGMDTDRVLIVTSDFHVCRAKYIARTLGMEAEALASPTWPWILKVNYYLREVFAFVKAFALAR